VNSGRRSLIAWRDCSNKIVFFHGLRRSNDERSTGTSWPADIGKPCAASDQYSLAVTVYEWLTGKRPFQGAPLEVQFQHHSAPPPPLHLSNQEISPQIEQVVLKALAKAPQERFPTITNFAEALHQAIEGISASELTTQNQFSTTPLAQQAPPLRDEVPSLLHKDGARFSSPSGRVPSRLWWRALIACLCLLLLVASSGIWFFVKQQSDKNGVPTTIVDVSATQQALQKAQLATATAYDYETIDNYLTNSPVGLTTGTVNGQTGVYLAWLNRYTNSDGANHIDIARSATGQRADFGHRVELTDSSLLGPGMCTFDGRPYVTFQGGELNHTLHIGYFDGSKLLAQGNMVTDNHGVVQTTWSRPSCAAYNGQLYIAWAGVDVPHHINLIASSDGMHFCSVTTFQVTVGCADPFPLCNSKNSVENIPTAPFITAMNFPGQRSRLYMSWYASDTENINIGYYDSANPSNNLQGLRVLSDTARADAVSQAYDGQLWLGWGTSTSSSHLFIASSTDRTSFPDNRSNPCGYAAACAAAFVTFNEHLYVADNCLAPYH
jgi:hypothetical protein